MNRKRACGAFTLIELLVVIAIIALLMSMLLPALSAAKERGKATACNASLHNIGMGVMLYTGVNKDWYPLSSHTTGSTVSAGAWLNSLDPFGVPKEARHCPSDPASSSRTTSYCTNDYFEPLSPGSDYDPVTHHTLPGGRTMALNRVSLVPRPWAVIYAMEAPGDGTVDHAHCVGWTTPDDVQAGIAVLRHRDGANYLFADGHASNWTWSSFRIRFRITDNPFNPETAQ